MSKASNIFFDGVLVDVNVRCWSGGKILTAEDLGLKEEDVAEAFKLGKKMLVPSAAIQKFTKIEGRARYVVTQNSFSFPIGHAFFVPRKRFAKVVARLQECKQEYNAQTDEFLQKYDEYRQEMIPVYLKAAETAYVNQMPEKQEFGIDYDPQADKQAFIDRFLQRIETFYPAPTELRGRFSLDWDVYEVSIPRVRKAQQEKIVKDQMAMEAYQEQIHAKISGFVDEVVQALRSQTVEVCSRVASNIKEGKVIHQATIASLKDFIDKFEELNFIGDKGIEDQLNSLRKEFLDIYSTKRINEVEEVQQELKRRLNVLVETASDMTDISSITGDYRRRILFQENETQEAA